MEVVEGKTSQKKRQTRCHCFSSPSSRAEKTSWGEIRHYLFLLWWRQLFTRIPRYILYRHTAAYVPALATGTRWQRSGRKSIISTAENDHALRTYAYGVRLTLPCHKYACDCVCAASPAYVTTRTTICYRKRSQSSYFVLYVRARVARAPSRTG